MNPQPVSLADELRKLAEWIQERKANALRLAEGKVGADKDGWLEDAEYYQRIEGALLAQHAVAEPQVSVPMREWLKAKRIELSAEQLWAVESYLVMNVLPIAPAQPSCKCKPSASFDYTPNAVHAAAEPSPNRAMRILESLTPTGSEFVGDPDACAAYVHKKISTLQDIAKNAVKARMAAHAAEQPKLTASRPPCRLDECPPGAFLFHGALGMKTEYGSEEIFVVDSGEYFWGGTSTSDKRYALIVQPVDLLTSPVAPPPQPVCTCRKENDFNFYPAVITGVASEWTVIEGCPIHDKARKEESCEQNATGSVPVKRSSGATAENVTVAAGPLEMLAKQDPLGRTMASGGIDPQAEACTESLSSEPPVAPGEQPPRGRNWTGTCCENGNFGEPHICMKQRGDLPPNISELHGLLLSLDRLLTDPHPGLMTWREQYEKASVAILAFYERPSDREEGK